MSLDLWDHLSSIVTGIVALGTLLAGLAGLLWRRRRAWWRTLAPFWAPRKDSGGADKYPLDAHVPALDSVFVPRRAIARNGHLTVPTDDLVLGHPGRVPVSGPGHVPLGSPGHVPVSGPGPVPLGSPGHVQAGGPGHVLLIGPPGSGKTALVRHAVAASARSWLASGGRRRRAPGGPVLIAVAAADLVRRTLEQAVTAAAKPWVPAMDRDPLRGHPLVVLVDGLDEVVDPNQRSHVINRLAHEAEPLRHWRLVVTTRPLGDRELTTLSRFAVHHLAPFTGADVTRLARAWFVNDADRAGAFVTWLEAQRLGASARSPLLTTVAAVLWQNEAPDVVRAPDPATLLDRFIDLLLRARQVDGPDVRDLLKAAAKASLAGTDVTRLPGHPPRDQVRKVLLATGIFAEQHGGLVPTWPSLIEFLAADPDDHDLSPQSLSTAVRDPARRAVATWAIGRSGRADTHLETMLTEPSGPADLARLIAAGLPMPDRLRTDVLAALATDRTATATALLTTLATDPAHLAKLHDIAADKQQPRTVRRAVQLFFAEQALL